MLKQFSKVIAAVSVAALVAVGCGSEDEPEGSAQPTPTGADEAADTAKAGDDDSDQADAADEGDASGAPTGGGSGTIDLDGEIIEVSSVRCHLESQPAGAAAGGGNILFVVQGEGQDSAGEPVLIDISRFDEDSMFAGDDVQIYIGEITMAGDAVELAAKVPAGTVTLDGGTARVDGLLVEDLASGTSATASIEISC